MPTGLKTIDNIYLHSIKSGAKDKYCIFGEMLIMAWRLHGAENGVVDVLQLQDVRAIRVVRNIDKANKRAGNRVTGNEVTCYDTKEKCLTREGLLDQLG